LYRYCEDDIAKGRSPVQQRRKMREDELKNERLLVAAAAEQRERERDAGAEVSGSSLDGGAGASEVYVSMQPDERRGGAGTDGCGEKLRDGRPISPVLRVCDDHEQAERAAEAGAGAAGGAAAAAAAGGGGVGGDEHDEHDEHENENRARLSRSSAQSSPAELASQMASQLRIRTSSPSKDGSGGSGGGGIPRGSMDDASPTTTNLARMGGVSGVSGVSSIGADDDSSVGGGGASPFHPAADNAAGAIAGGGGLGPLRRTYSLPSCRAVSFTSHVEVYDIGSLKELKKEKKRAAAGEGSIFAAMRAEMRVFVDAFMNKSTRDEESATRWGAVHVGYSLPIA
jgi:hypothetical protein